MILKFSTWPVSDTWIVSESPPGAPPVPLVPLLTAAKPKELCWSDSCRMSCCTTRTATMTPGNQNSQNTRGNQKWSHFVCATRPSHADLPSIPAPLLPREELDEVCFSGDDDLSLGTRERLPSSNNVSTNQEEDAGGPRCQLEKRLSEGSGQERPSTRGKEQEDARNIDSRHTTVLKHRVRLPARGKAHRKIDRRKTGKPPTSLPSPEAPRGDACALPHSVPQPWHSWRKERWAAFKEEAFATPRGDLVDQTIEEVGPNAFSWREGLQRMESVSSFFGKSLRNCNCEVKMGGEFGNTVSPHDSV